MIECGKQDSIISRTFPHVNLQPDVGVKYDVHKRPSLSTCTAGQLMKQQKRGGCIGEWRMKRGA